MTREQAKELLYREQERLKTIEHFANGGKVEICVSDLGEPIETWLLLQNPDFHTSFKYRAAPEPKYRPWQNAKEAVGAVGCFTRLKGCPYVVSITSIANRGVYLGKDFLDYNYLFQLREITYDNGKTWVPCGIKE